jgi:hypothetical protein
LFTVLSFYVLFLILQLFNFDAKIIIQVLIFVNSFISCCQLLWTTYIILLERLLLCLQIRNLPIVVFKLVFEWYYFRIGGVSLLLKLCLEHAQLLNCINLIYSTLHRVLSQLLKMWQQLLHLVIVWNLHRCKKKVKWLGIRVLEGCVAAVRTIIILLHNILELCRIFVDLLLDFQEINH